MKNLVFYGDGLLCPPEGYGEQLVDLLVLRHPEVSFQSFHPGEMHLTLDAALKGAPFQVLGKAPEFVYLGLGHPDFLKPADPNALYSSLESLVQLILQKTRAKVAFTSVCEAFLPEESQRDMASVYNRRLPSLANDRVLFLDMNSSVNAFLEIHRRGPGEKRALHQQSLQLTSMGRVFMSNMALENLPWSNL